MESQPIISVVGLGYVGLTTAVAFSSIKKVIAFDINTKRITELKNGYDRNDEVLNKELINKNLYFTDNPEDLKEANFYIIAVPTPLDKTNHPNLSMLLSASEIVGKQLKRGDIVVYESTVYPGATEEQCIPVLTRTSQLKLITDFSVGFSPERINPADKEHVFQNIIKIVSATDEKALEVISNVYKDVVKAGVFPVSTIRAAEACKVIENTQRDINIAFMNDIAIMLHALGIETREVIEAMKTKWNYVPFQPGLVGGHCIGINPYYLLHKAEEIGYHSDIIAIGRRVNESMAKFIADQAIKQLIKNDILIKKARVAVLGLTYKENCSDIRDTRVIDIINELKSYNIQVIAHDPIADPQAAKNEYGIELVDWADIKNMDAIILTVAHKYYINLSPKEFAAKLNKRGLLMDVKDVFKPEQFSETDIMLWRL